MLGTVLSELTMSTPLEAVGGPQREMEGGGMPVPGSSGLSPTPWRRQGLALLSF